MRKKDIAIVGAGGFGREVLWQLRDADSLAEQYNVLGFVDDDPELLGKTLSGITVVGNIQWLIEYSQSICAAICIGNPSARKNVYDRLSQNPLVSFPNIIAKDVKFSESVEFGQGCIICLSTIITVDIRIGNFVIINLDCTIGHDAVLSDFVTLHPSVNVSGNVHIETCSEIGTGVNIIQGKIVGEYTTIGAGASVVRDILEPGTYVGVPARKIK